MSENSRSTNEIKYIGADVLGVGGTELWSSITYLQTQANLTQSTLYNISLSLFSLKLYLNTKSKIKVSKNSVVYPNHKWDKDKIPEESIWFCIVQKCTIFLKICHNSFKKLGNKFSFPWSSIYLPTELKFKYEPCRVGDIVDILSIDKINLYNIF